MSENIDNLVQKMTEAETCFRRACRQILVLNRSLVDLQSRYDMAMKQNARAFRYSLRVRIAVLEGVRNMFFEYASMKADLIVELRKQIQEEHEMASAALDCEEDDMHREYYDEYDVTDSELEYSDIDFSDVEEDEEAVNLNFSVLVVNNVDSLNAVETNENPLVARSAKETDLNTTEVSLDSGYLDDSNLEDDFV